MDDTTKWTLALDGSYAPAGDVPERYAAIACVDWCPVASDRHELFDIVIMTVDGSAEIVASVERYESDASTYATAYGLRLGSFDDEGEARLTCQRAIAIGKAEFYARIERAHAAHEAKRGSPQ